MGREGLEVAEGALFFDCQGVTNNATRGDVLTRWPEAFDEDVYKGPGRSLDTVLVEDADFLEYVTTQYAQVNLTPSGPLNFGGAYVRCDFRQVPFTIRPIPGALFYACQGIANNATREQILALHPTANVS